MLRRPRQWPSRRMRTPRPAHAKRREGVSSSADLCHPAVYGNIASLWIAASTFNRMVPTRAPSAGLATGKGARSVIGCPWRREALPWNSPERDGYEIRAAHRRCAALRRWPAPQCREALPKRSAHRQWRRPLPAASRCRPHPAPSATFVRARYGSTSSTARNTATMAHARRMSRARTRCRRGSYWSISPSRT